MYTVSVPSRSKNFRRIDEADLLNFHGIHGQFFSYLALPFLTRNKPAVFTVRDMWPLTGHCAVSYDCERWKTGCGQLSLSQRTAGLADQTRQHAHGVEAQKLGVPTITTHSGHPESSDDGASPAEYARSLSHPPYPQWG